ncbi:MAG: hypothetical protein ACD_62C00330G0004 [uncultured bacterium]|nr:MAG: hypothetical protein ACD_62C00330G0004 [uncultured bacterium]HLD45830.1 hypothetical protein [bacterium]
MSVALPQTSDLESWDAFQHYIDQEPELGQCVEVTDLVATGQADSNERLPSIDEIKSILTRANITIDTAKTLRHQVSRFAAKANMNPDVQASLERES